MLTTLSEQCLLNSCGFDYFIKGPESMTAKWRTILQAPASVNRISIAGIKKTEQMPPNQLFMQMPRQASTADVAFMARRFSVKMKKVMAKNQGRRLSPVAPLN
jgi:hypothetical protein